MDLSRFSNLPGIDTHNADFYESSDLPEVDQIERLFRSGSWFKLHVSFSFIFLSFRLKNTRLYVIYQKTSYLRQKDRNHAFAWK